MDIYIIHVHFFEVVLVSFAVRAGAVLVGSLLLGVGVNAFLVPYKVLDGGIIGIGLIVKYLWGMKAGMTIILLSVPIFALAWFYNRIYFYNSLHGMLLSSFFIDLLGPLQRLGHFYFSDPAISAVIGGGFVGLGIGVMLRYQTSTGGTDLLAQFLAERLNMNVGIVIFFIDFAVIGLGGLFISSQTLLLSLVAILSVGLMTSLCTWESSR